MTIRAMSPEGAKWNSDRLEYTRTRESIASDVLRLRAEGVPIRALAKRFQVSYVTCWRICRAAEKKNA
jgi:transposase